MATVIYIHDPMCSWCWGFRPAWQQLQATLVGSDYNIQYEYVVGGLAPDSDVPMDSATQQYVKANWERIQQHIPGTPFNYDFWTLCQPRRSTYPACRAVLSAKQQGEHADGISYESAMILAIQQAYYLEAKNPSDQSVLDECANSIGLHVAAFREFTASDECESLLQQQFARYRTLASKTGVSGFPSMVLMEAENYTAIPIDYHHPQTMVNHILSSLS